MFLFKTRQSSLLFANEDTREYYYIILNRALHKAIWQNPNYVEYIAVLDIFQYDAYSRYCNEQIMILNLRQSNILLSTVINIR